MTVLRIIQSTCFKAVKSYFEQPLIPITIALLSFTPTFIAYLLISSLFVPDRDADFLIKLFNLIITAIALFLCFIFYPAQISLITNYGHSPFQRLFNKLKNILTKDTIKFFMLLGLAILLFFAAGQLILVAAGMLVLLNLQSLVPFHSVLYGLAGICFCYFLGVVTTKLNESVIDEEYKIKTLILWFNMSSIKEEVYFILYNIINGLVLSCIILIYINTMADAFLLKLLVGFEFGSSFMLNMIMILIAYFILTPIYLISITMFNIRIKNNKNKT